MDRASALRDISVFQAALEQQFAYRRLRSIDYRELLTDLGNRTESEVNPQWLGLELQKIIARFTDSHAAVNVKPSPDGYLPFLVESVGDDSVALEANRSGLLQPECPFLLSMDGVDIGDWLEAAQTYVTVGSPQYVRRGRLVWLRAVAMLRRDLGLPESEHVAVVLAGRDREARVELRVDVQNRAPQYGSWPRTNSRVLPGNVGYLRIDRMHPEAGVEALQWLERFRNTRGIVIDVRGNSGGTRDALMTLLPCLMRPQQDPLVINVAAYRLHETISEDALTARYLYPVNSEKWSPKERAVLGRHMELFESEWDLPAGEFSDWYASVVSPADIGGGAGYGDKPIVVLSDAKSFSACDVFLSAVKHLPYVTVVGEPSGGGSGAARQLELPASGLKLKLSTMVSFQASGQLFEGNGVQPDVLVRPEPSFFVHGGRDVVLEQGITIINQAV